MLCALSLSPSRYGFTVCVCIIFDRGVLRTSTFASLYSGNIKLPYVLSF